MDGPADPLTVATALRDTPLRDAVVAAGATGLGRTIETVGVLDVGELDALRPGQLVLSTAVPLRRLDVDRLVARLEQAGVSALGVKPGPQRALAPELVAACEQRALPLLALPPGRFEALVHPVLEAILARQSERLRQIDALHDALAHAALGNAPLPAIAARVAAVLGAEVAVLDADGTVLTATGDAEPWTRAALVAHAASVAEPRPVTVDGATFLLAPISATARRYGAIGAAGPLSDEAFARATLVQAAVVCGMQLVGERRVERIHRRFERELLEELADRELTHEEARERARRLGWRPRAPYVTLLIAHAEGDGPAVARSLARWERDVRTFPRRAGLAVVVQLRGAETAAEAAEAVVQRLASVPHAAATTTAIGAGRARSEPVELRAALREARLALAAARGATAPEGHIALAQFDALGAVRLAACVEDGDLPALARELLGPLGDPQLPGGADLIATLDALLERNMRLGDVATDLHFHYSTVRHRLARLRKLLGERIDRPDQRPALALALAALRVTADAEAAAIPLNSGAPSASRSRRRSAPTGSRPAR